MPISDILLYVDNCVHHGRPGGSRARPRAAARRAHRGGGRQSTAAAVLRRRGWGILCSDRRVRGDARARAASGARAVRRGDGGRNGYAESSEWREAEGDLVPALAVHARYADLTIVSQVDPENDAGVELDFPGDLALASGRPVLAIPYIGAKAPLGRKILLGWNGSREAARAVADAMVFLQEADEVCVLTISEQGIRETAGNDLARYLARHGVRADVETMAAGKVSVGDLMLNVAMDRGSDASSDGLLRSLAAARGGLRRGHSHAAAIDDHPRAAEPLRPSAGEARVQPSSPFRPGRRVRAAATSSRARRRAAPAGGSGRRGAGG